MDAFTARLTIHDLTKCVGTAGILAWINAAMFVADGMHRAVFGTGAISFWLAAVHVRIAHVIRRTPAHRIIRWTGDAERCRMTRIWMTRFHGNTLDVGYRVWTKPRRTLADRLVIISDADSVHAARILVANTVAGVREPIAELRRWTVDVVDARHRTASGR